MSKRTVALCALLLPAFLLVSCSKMKPLPPEMAADAPVTAAPWATGPDAGKSSVAFMESVAAQKHLFLYFYAPGKDNANSRKAFADTLLKLDQVARPFYVNIKDPGEKAVVQRFQLAEKNVPLPLVIALAPNGTIVNGFPKDRIAEPNLMSAVASPAFQRCLKALQESKLLIVCASKPDPKKGAMVPTGVLDFCKDPQYKDKTRVVTVDPTDPMEALWLKQIQIVSDGKDPHTCLLVPPGRIAANIVGPVKKKALVEALNPPQQGMGGPGGPGAAPPPPSNPPPAANQPPQ